MMSTKKNIIYNLLGQGTLAIFGYLSVKFVYAGLGSDALGIIVFSSLACGIVSSVFELGICSTTVREISINYQSDIAYVARLIQTFSCYFFLLSATGAFAIYFSAPFVVNGWVELKDLSHDAATDSFRIISVALILSIPKALYASSFRGLGKMSYPNLIDVLVGCTQQGGTVILINFGSSLVQVAVWIAFASLAQVCIYCFLLGRYLPWRAFVPKWNSEAWSRTSRFSRGMALMSLATLIHMQVDKIVVSKLLPIGVLGYYSVAFGTVHKATIFHASIVTAVFPEFASAFGRGDFPSLKRNFTRYHDIVCFGAVPLFCLIIFFSIPLYGYIFDHEVAKNLLVPSILLAIGFYMSATINIPYFFVLASGDSGLCGRLGVYALFFSVPVSVLLVYCFGLIGAGCSVFVYHVFAYIYFVPRACKIIGITTAVFFLHLGKVFALATITYGFCFSVLFGASNFSVLEISVCFFMATVLYGILAVRLIDVSLSIPLKRFFCNIFRK